MVREDFQSAPSLTTMFYEFNHTDMGIAAFGLVTQEEAINWLERAYEERDIHLLDIKKYYIYEVLGGHLRVQELMKRIGIPSQLPAHRKSFSTNQVYTLRRTDIC